MRILTKEDIEKWNSRLKQINLELAISGHNLLIFKIDGYSAFQGNFLGTRTQYTATPNLYNYRFSFSVSENILKRFDSILDKFLEEGMEFTFLSDKQYYGDKRSIRFARSEFDKILSINNHKIHNVNYQQRIYNFYEVNILKAIYFITCIDDAVNIIQEYFEYEEDGTEICKIKFPVGSIVSTNSDRGGDYMVQNVIFTRDKMGFLYEIAKMNIKANSEIIMFSNTYRIPESELYPNRDDRINSLLN